MLELWRMQCTSSLPLLPGPLNPGVVAPDRVLSMGQIELNCVLMLNWIVWKTTANMYKKRFCIKWPTMVDMPLNQTKLTLSKTSYLELSLKRTSLVNISIWGLASSYRAIRRSRNALYTPKKVNVSFIPFIRLSSPIFSIAYLILFLVSFLHHLLLAVFYRNLSDAFEYLCCGLYGLDSTSDLKFLQFLSKPLGTIPRVPTTIAIIATLMFHGLIHSMARSKNLSFKSVWLFNAKCCLCIVINFLSFGQFIWVPLLSILRKVLSIL